MVQAHDHCHDSAPLRPGRAFAIGIGLNLAFVLVEAGFGWHAKSLALLADATVPHDDVLRTAREALEQRLGIHHATLQLESAKFAAHCVEVAPPY